MPPPREGDDQPRLALAASLAAAAVLPTLLAFNVSPSPTFLNQALAYMAWGGVATLVFWGATWPRARDVARQAWPLFAALALLAAAAAWSWGPGALPSSLAVSAIGTLAAATLVALSGTVARASNDRVAVFAGFCAAWAGAGVLNAAIGAIQVFAPAWPDGDWIAHSNIVGRAVGNLRQPNHLSSVLLWAAIGVVALVQLRCLRFGAGAVLFLGMVFGVVLTASRTGLVSIALLALWGLVDAHLYRRVRALLVASPLFYAAAWKAMVWWSDAMQHTFGGTARLAETDVSGSRFGIWGNTLTLIAREPWAGVGFGEFNFAWTLTPFPGRPTAFFDHTHNLPLQLAVELGLPLAALVTLLLLWALARLFRTARHATGDESTCLRAAGLMVVMIGLHSLLEYPLWYAYFLLPTAWAFGYGLGAPDAPGNRRGRPLAAAGVITMLLAALAVWDYKIVADIFSAAEGSPPLAQRIARGQRSVLFAHHADYAAATTDSDPELREHAFDRATHYLLDTRLMVAWAEELAARGQTDAARHITARLREFRNPASHDFLAACERPASAPAGDRPFQCAPPSRALSWREFLAP
jgi:O-antigen ligase